MRGHLGQTARAVVVSLLVALPGFADTLHIGAASSLRNVVDTWVADFGTKHPKHEVVASYGASSTLAAQLRAGAPLHLLLLADPEMGKSLAAELDLPAATPFARNRLVVVARDAALRTVDVRGRQKESRTAAAAVPSGLVGAVWRCWRIG